MLSNLYNLIANYKTKWLPADLVFIADAISNSVMATQYKAFIMAMGIDPVTANALISILEVMRIASLLYERSNNRPPESS